MIQLKHLVTSMSMYQHFYSHSAAEHFVMFSYSSFMWNVIVHVCRQSISPVSQSGGVGNINSHNLIADTQLTNNMHQYVNSFIGMWTEEPYRQYLDWLLEGNWNHIRKVYATVLRIIHFACNAHVTLAVSNFKLVT